MKTVEISDSLVIGAKTVGTMLGVSLVEHIPAIDVHALIEVIIQLIVAAGGLIALFKKKKKEPEKAE